jgi:hypothetical protein
MTLYYMLTDVTVILADCAMTGDCMTSPLLRLVGRSVRRVRDGVILKSTTNKGGLL